MNLTVMIPQRSDPGLHRTIQRIIETCPDLPEIIVINDGCGMVPNLPDCVVQHCLDEAMGTSYARHIGMTLAANDAVCTMDAHMDFHGEGWAEAILKEHEAYPEDILCCRTPHLNLNEGFTMQAPKSVYTGAAVIWKVINDEDRHIPLNMRWKSQPVGEISCVMGACYTLSKSRYQNVLNEPWKLGRSWGLDEGTISISNWICGGTSRLIAVEVGHIFNSARGFGMTAQERASVIYNRFRLISTLPMDEEERIELREWLLKSSSINLRTVARVIGLLDNPDIISMRNHLAAQTRTMDDFLNHFGITKEPMDFRESKPDKKTKPPRRTGTIHQQEIFN